jgi:hypothetical protein
MITYNVVRNGSEVVDMFSKARFGLDAEAYAHDRADELREQQLEADFHISVSVPKVQITLLSGEKLEQYIGDSESEVYETELSGVFYSDFLDFSSFRRITPDLISNIEYIA